jgi:glyoxylase-like metal-dependent hydrolase (beta-lactamase superfamily II)
MRRVLLVVVMLVLIAIVMLTSVLSSAHRQIRRVDPPLPDVAELLSSVSAGPGPTLVRYVNSASQRNADRGTMGHVAIVFDWEDGSRFIIDQGMDRTTAAEFGRPMEMLLGSEPLVPHGTVAEQMGRSVASVEALAFTHLHHDHTQGVVAFCREHAGWLPIFQTPLQFSERNHTTDMGYTFIEEARALPGSMDCAAPTPLDAGSLQSIYPLPGFPGIVAVPAGGHTPGSTLYLARVEDHYWLFSGDITNTRRELLENLPKASLYSWLIVPENTDRTRRLREWLRDLDERPDLTVIVSHDLTALERTAIRAW